MTTDQSHAVALYDAPNARQDYPLLSKFMAKDVSEKVMAAIGVNSMALQHESINNVKEYLKDNQERLMYVYDVVQELFAGVGK